MKATTAVIGGVIIILIAVIAIAGWHLGWFGEGAGTVANGETSYSGTSMPDTGSGSLDGMSFKVASIDSIALPADSDYLVSFADGQMRAKVCNSMSGPYVAENGVLTARLVSTLMACTAPAGIMNVEQGLMAALAGTSTAYALSGGTLTVSGQGHTAVLTSIAQ